MSVKKLFNEQECNLIIEALEIYKSEAIPLMSIEKHNELINSSISKLQNLSPFTCFSDDELNIIYLATDFFEANCNTVPPCIYKLLLKLKDHNKFE